MRTVPSFSTHPFYQTNCRQHTHLLSKQRPSSLIAAINCLLFYLSSINLSIHRTTATSTTPNTNNHRIIIRSGTPPSISFSFTLTPSRSFKIYLLRCSIFSVIFVLSPPTSLVTNLLPNSSITIDRLIFWSVY